MPSSTSPLFAERAQVWLRLKTVLALIVVVVIMAATLLVAINHGGSGSWGWLLGLAWLAVVVLYLFIPSRSFKPGLARYTPVRAGMLASTGLLAASTAGSSFESLFTTLTVVLGAGTIVGERVLRSFGLGGGHAVLQLPGAGRAPRVFRLTQPIAYLQLAFLGYGVLVAALDLSAVGWFILGAVIATLMLIRATSVFFRRRFNGKVERSLPSLISDYAPEFAIYTARPDDASYQVAMWLPYFERTGKKFIIITRAEKPSHALAELTDAPVILRKRLSDLDDLVVPSLSTIFYVNASSGNGAMVRYSQFTHVYLGHGDSDKAPSYNPTHAMYDRIYAAGPAATRRYAAHGVVMDPEKFTIVGRPQLEILEPAPAEVPPDPTVLYAPTWRGHVEETFLHSIPSAVAIVTALLQRGVRVIFRPHPFSYHFQEDAEIIREVHELLSADTAKTATPHLYGAAAEKELDIIGCMNASDAMISDVSSVVSDYLFSAKPLAMVVVNTPMATFCEEYPIARAAYLLASDLRNIEEVLAQLLGSDPMRARRAELREDYLGDFPIDTYASAFIQAANKTIEQRHTASSVEALESVDVPEADSEDGEEIPVDDEEASNLSDDAELAAIDSIADVKSRARRLARKRIRRVRNKALRMARYFLPDVFAGLALGATAAFGINSYAFLVPALLALAIFVYLHRRGFRSQVQMNRALGSVPIARSLVAVTLLAGMAVGGHGWASIVGPGLAFLAISVEGQAVAVWRAAGLQSRNLPGTEKARPLPFARGWAGMTSALALAAMSLSAVLLTDSGFAQLIIGVISLAVTLYVLARGLHRRYVNLELDSRLPELLDNVAPRFCVYFGSTVGVSYQLGMWVPYLDRIGEPYVVVTRDLKMMRAAAKVTDAPVIYRRTLASLEDVLIPGMTTAFYVNNAVKNTHLIERRELTHVWLNHGDSEKAACYNPVHGIYDKIFAAGQAGIDRYERHGVIIPREKFEIVGRPQIEATTRKQEHEGPPTVLYAPTWRGPYADTAVYSLPIGQQIVRSLLARGCTVVFRAHPFNYRYPEARAMMRRIRSLLNQDAQETGRNHVFGRAAEQDMGFADCFNVADAMISDVSAMVSDFLQSAKPFAVVAANTTVEQLHSDMPATQSGYVLHGDLCNLDEVLDNLLIHDVLAERREEIREYYLGDFPADSYADGFIDAARGVVCRTLVGDPT
ncbi:CDP-glycerol glycerophosphotransferase family protein [Arthrobacter rhombi]|uniref:CDP-glycerol glycerophosphotransferase family protein n=1 Tax=Arthrobacter rhombi TaxID=71253 RepID=UPI003FCF5E0D